MCQVCLIGFTCINSHSSLQSYEKEQLFSHFTVIKQLSSKFRKEKHQLEIGNIYIAVLEINESSRQTIKDIEDLNN